MHLPARCRDQMAARPLLWALGLALLLCAPVGPGALAAATGKVQGRVVATDTGDPIGDADVALLPADSTMHPVGMLTNADGTFLLEALPGRYVLRVLALSYSPKRIEGLLVQEGTMMSVGVTLAPDAIPQDEVVVESTVLQNTEASVLAERKKAAAVGDGVSAEQVRRSPDKDAAEVLRRVTGLSVASGRFVFVRGLGERYSSTEVDGVRIASPEQNKRVVPLDLLPANLVDHIVVQKTYTADRPGEFGGGDVQVHTRDFPGERTWSVTVSQGVSQGTTFHGRRTDVASRSDVIGFGSGARSIPDAVDGVAVPGWSPSSLSTLASMGRSFRNVWNPRSLRAIPNAGYSATYGDEWKLFGRPLGLIESLSFSRSFDTREESQRFYSGDFGALAYDYATRRWSESAQLGGLSGLSYRLSPHHSLHLRGLFSHDADDEIRVYEGPDYNVTEAITGTPLVHRNTRFLYVERSVVSGALEGEHEFSHLLGASLDWKVNRSSARRQQPDRRELTYDRRYYFEGDTAHWVLGSIARREFGDLHDDGWGSTASTTVPYRLGRLGNGKAVLGYDHQAKRRDNFYRRFNLYPNANLDREAPPEVIFDPSGFDGSPNSGWVEDATINDPLVGVDNYRAHQRVTAGYASFDVPFGAAVRGTFGVRVEHGFQDVVSFPLFRPDVVLAEGRLDNTDWLPSGNLTWAITQAVNLRLAASRTVSRPDLNELSPSPTLEYVGGMLIRGNPELKRALLDNYDLRLEAFPSHAEVLAAGFFYKRLHDPIEQVIRGGTPHVLEPSNSDHGHNLGVELEARAGLGRLTSRLERFALNTNASIIASEVRLSQTSQLGTDAHPLQGQASYTVNASLAYALPSGRMDAAILASAIGRRLVALGSFPLPDIYERPNTLLDATLSFVAFRDARVKLAGRNLLDRRIEQLQAGREAFGTRNGRSVSIALTVGS